MDDALAGMQGWEAGFVAAAVVGPDGIVASRGELDRSSEWASLTKLVTSVAMLRAVEAGTIALDEDAGPPGSTVRHLLAHTSGLPFEGSVPISAPKRHRIY